jgi:hypothetical protein
VITDDWWFNSKVNGKGAFLHPIGDRSGPDPWSVNLAEREPAVVGELFEKGVAAAAGGFPQFLLDAAENAEDAPGCSPLAAAPLTRAKPVG